MLLQELLGINEDVYFVEESYLAQRTIERTLDYLKGVRRFAEARKVRLLRVYEGEHTLGLLLFNSADEEVPVDFWSVFTGALARDSSKKNFEALADSLLTFNLPERDIEISSETWRDVVNEYYSLMLVNRNLCRVARSGPSLTEVSFLKIVCERSQKSLMFFKKRGFTLKAGFLKSAVEMGCPRLLSTGLGSTRWL